MGDVTADSRLRELRGALVPSELAEVAVLGDLGLVLEVLGWFVPTIGVVFQGLAVVPFAALAARRRARAGLVAMVAAASVAFLVGGVGIVLETAIAGTLGLSIGITYRRNWRPSAAMGVAVVIAGIPVALLSLAAQAASPGLRRLAFAQVRIVEKFLLQVWSAVRRVLVGLHADGLVRFGDSVTARATQALNWAISHWWLSVPLLEVLLVVMSAGLCSRYLRPLLVRLEQEAPLPGEDILLPTPTPTPTPSPTPSLLPRPVPTGTPAPEVARDEPTVAGSGVPAPLPVRLESVSYQYPGSHLWAVAQVSLEITPGSLVALVGPNGSGKSTLVRIIAGRLAPTLGEVFRAGPPGLGQPRGTSMVFQRPESQVLGVRVMDDVVWGLPASTRPDVAALLARVGLGGFEARETSSLSGGELQRLAIAAALARSPQLLISDESTAMIDADGRHAVVRLLEELAAEGLTVVHVTHRKSEVANADQVVHLRAGRTVEASNGAPPAPRPRRTESPSDRARVHAGPGSTGSAGIELVSLKGVGYVYANRTPWARRALEGVDLELARGEGVVITGSNGSGKSTLAWILAGLTQPTEGRAQLDGELIQAGSGAVGIAFQHSRLQLLRPTVAADVAYGADEARATDALRAVGLDPAVIGPRRVDELSGGEQRRVALAGLLVRDPELIVLDEPYAGLDDEARAGLAEVLRSLRHERAVATVVVSHDLDNAELLGDRLLVLEGGRIVGERSLEAGT